MSERYEQRPQGVWDNVAGKLLRPRSPEWQAYEIAMSKRLTVPVPGAPPAVAPTVPPVPPAALEARRREARARINGRLGQAMWPRRAIVTLSGGTRLHADPMHLIYYLMLNSRGNFAVNPATVLDVSGNVVQVTAPLMQEIIRACAQRMSNFMTVAGSMMAEVASSAVPEAVVIERDWHDEDREGAHVPGGEPLPHGSRSPKD